MSERATSRGRGATTTDEGTARGRGGGDHVAVAIPADVDAPERICQILKIGIEMLAALPDPLLLEAMRHHSFTLADQAAVFGRKAQQVKEDPLKTHFERQERRTLEPWRVEAERFAQRRRLWSAETNDRLASAFLDLAKNKALSPLEVLLGSYCIFGQKDALHFLGSLIVREQPHDRLKAHNFFIGSELGEEFMAQHGAILERLTSPLFPPDDRFSALNTQLLREVRESVEGGGSKTKTETDMFRNSRSGDIFSSTSGVHGGGTLPVTYDQAGSLAVDVTPVEHAFGNVYAELAKLQGELKDLKDAARATSCLNTVRRSIGQARGAFRRVTQTKFPRRGPRGGDGKEASDAQDF